MVARIMKAILNSYDIQVLDSILGDRNFGFFLKVQQCTYWLILDQLGIDFLAVFENKIKIRMLYIFPQEIAEKINIVHRASFVRENILDLSRESRMESMLKIIIQDKYQDIVTYIIHAEVLKKVSILTLNEFITEVLEMKPELIK